MLPASPRISCADANLNLCPAGGMMSGILPFTLRAAALRRSNQRSCRFVFRASCPQPCGATALRRSNRRSCRFVRTRVGLSPPTATSRCRYHRFEYLSVCCANALLIIFGKSTLRVKSSQCTFTKPLVWGHTGI